MYSFCWPGGREDGLGITVVTGLVQDGPAQEALVDILPGDVLSKVTVRRRKRLEQSDKLADQEEFVQAKTEGLCYDETVTSILILPPVTDSYQETFQLVLKRIRQKPRVKVNLLYPPSQKENDTTIELFAGENLRMGMLLRGVKLSNPLAQGFDSKANDGMLLSCRWIAKTTWRIPRDFPLLNHKLCST